MPQKPACLLTRSYGNGVFKHPGTAELLVDLRGKNLALTDRKATIDLAARASINRAPAWQAQSPCPGQPGTGQPLPGQSQKAEAQRDAREPSGDAGLAE